MNCSQRELLLVSCIRFGNWQIKNLPTVGAVSKSIQVTPLGSGDHHV
jgi:hypothetical protein